MACLVVQLVTPPLRAPMKSLNSYVLPRSCALKPSAHLQTFALRSVQGCWCKAVLLSVHTFFDALGGEEIRKRGAREDKPLRMVKTVLHELCKLKVCEIVRCFCVSYASLRGYWRSRAWPADNCPKVCELSLLKQPHGYLVLEVHDQDGAA
eukprot:scaffold253973_cov45-Tisochrysis_lutea.AAC.2